MATLDNGTYIIVNEASGRVLDVAANGAVDGSNIQIYDRNNTDAQIWIVADAGTSKRIYNRLSGKSLDVDGATQAAGTNVQIWTNTDPEWAGQLLTATDSTTAHDTYPLYYISMTSNTNLVFQAMGTANGSNVELQDKDGGSDQLWYFVPVPAFRDGGIYEVASALNWNLRLDVAGAGSTNGTNLQLFASNHTNAQKFYVTAETTGYSLRSAATGKYVDVDGAVAADGTNCQMWDDNDTNAQRWNLVSYGTATVDGETVNTYRLGSYVDGAGSTYYMNVANATSSSNANVQIHTLTSTPDDCLFALIPTYEADDTIPVPYDLGVSSSVQGSFTRDFAEQNADFYPTWKCADAWVTSGPNHYEIRSRQRLMSSSNSTWSAWSAWSDWDTANTTQDGNRFWEQRAAKIAYNYNATKCAQFQFQIRACGVAADGKSQVTGQAATQTINVYRLPVMTWGDAGWTPEGLRLSWTSDYRFGSSEVYLKELKYKAPLDDAISGNVLVNPRTIKGTSFTRSALIPADQLTKWVDDGDYVYLVYNLGYDQAAPYKYGDARVTAHYDAGSETVEPILQWHGVILLAIVPDLGVTKLWLKTDDQLWECAESDITPYPDPGDPEDPTDDEDYSSGYKVFEVVYPMGIPFQLYASTTNSSGSRWGTDVTDVAAIEKYFHAFTWTDDDGKECRVYIEAFNEGRQSFQVTKNAVYQADVLDDRPYESVSSAKTVRTHLSISGVLMDDLTTNVEDARYMVNNHVRWRSPIHGNYADLYISDVTLTERNNRTEISISAIKETI